MGKSLVSCFFLSKSMIPSRPNSTSDLGFDFVPSYTGCRSNLWL